MKTKYVVMEISGKKLMENGKMSINSDVDSCDWFWSMGGAENAAVNSGLSLDFVEVKTVKQARETFQNS